LRRTVMALATVAAVLVGTFGTVTVRALDCAPDDYICQELLDSKNQQSATADQLAVIQHQIKDTQKQMTALFALITQVNNQITAQQAQIDATTGQIQVLDAKIALTQAEITRRQAHLQVREALFGQRVRAIEKHGSVNYLALALSSSSFNQLIDRLITAQEIIQSDHKLLDDLRLQKAQLQDLTDQLSVQRGQQADLLTKQQAQKARLQASRDQQQAALAYQRQLEAQYKAQADALAQQKAQIDAQVAALQALFDSEATGAGGGTGQFSWPENPHLISQRYGCSPYFFEMYWPACPTRHLHSGIDIAEPYGQPVMAADSGVASLYSTGYGYGNYIIVTHGNGYATLYGHLAGFAVRNQQLVYRGQTIAYEGSTGNSTGPHLHFEVRYNGNYVDPCLYLGC
jgi:murein DD-endopeptidase MepM/ murein hydrolase activator NlpD